MSFDSDSSIFSEWTDEICHYLTETKILCIALFDGDKRLEFATPVMHTLFKGNPAESFINPTIDRLLNTDSDQPLVFQGMITIGDYLSLNNTISADVYRKNGRLLIIGGVEAPELIDQYMAMQQLNQQINTLQRELLREKITLEKTLDQLNETNEELKHLNASKDKFFSIISHDLKSPFNTILGFSELLQEQIKNQDYSEMALYSELVHKSATKAFELLVNLIDWSRSQSGRIQFNPEVFNVVETISDLSALFKETAEQKGIQIYSNLPLTLEIFADKHMINTVLRNLISNAIKFTPQDGIIYINCQKKEKEVLFSIKDTGVGISESSIPKLFRIDEHYTTEGTNQEAGTGLGLILCREFIEKHNGQIWVQSTEGKGTTFFFTIPMLECS